MAFEFLRLKSTYDTPGRAAVWVFQRRSNALGVGSKIGVCEDEEDC